MYQRAPQPRRPSPPAGLPPTQATHGRRGTRAGLDSVGTRQAGTETGERAWANPRRTRPSHVTTAAPSRPDRRARRADRSWAGSRARGGSGPGPPGSGSRAGCRVAGARCGSLPRNPRWGRTGRSKRQEAGEERALQGGCLGAIRGGQRAFELVPGADLTQPLLRVAQQFSRHGIGRHPARPAHQTRRAVGRAAEKTGSLSRWSTRRRSLTASHSAESRSGPRRRPARAAARSRPRAGHRRLAPTAR